MFKQFRSILLQQSGRHAGIDAAGELEKWLQLYRLTSG